MSATIRGGADLSRFLAELPAKLESNVLRGALKAGAEEIAKVAREDCRSPQVRDAIGTTSSSSKGIVTAKIRVKGDGAYLAPWLEYGTDPHFISVDAEAAGGRTVRRINRLAKNDSLVINGHFVGSSIHHPGAKPYPFMRPALDTAEGAAIAAIGAHITAKLTKAGIEAPVVDEPEE